MKGVGPPVVIRCAAVALRLIEVIVRDQDAAEALEACRLEEAEGVWASDYDDEHTGVRVLIDADNTETVLDRLSQRFEERPGFRALVYRLEAALPRIERDEKARKERRYGRSRLSRAELRGLAEDGAELNGVFVAAVLLSTVVAVVGLHRNDVAVIVGAMVLAPLLGPNVSLAMGTTLGDADLIWASLRKNVLGVSLALGLAIVAGLYLPIDLASPAIQARTQAAFLDLALAGAAGAAGGLAFTTGVPASLIGVMVAVALLPPTVVLGLHLGATDMQAAGGAGVLLAINVVCVNLAAVAAFVVQGVRPREWWDADRARAATRTALFWWSAGLAALALLLTRLQ